MTTAALVVASGLSATPANAVDDPPVFSEDFAAGLAGWTAVGGGQVTGWVARSDTDTSWIQIDNRSASSGSYLEPAGDIDLPANAEVSFQVSVDALGSGGTTSLVVGVPQDATRIQDGGIGIQIAGEGSVRTVKPVTTPLCSTSAPVRLGATASVTVQRYDGLVRFLIDGDQVAVHAAGATPAAGETLAIGAYRALTRLSAVSARGLSARPSGFPTSATGCGWTPPVEVQPVMVNQSGYDFGMPKRFTAPVAEDGATFDVLDPADAVVATGTVTGGVGDFSTFEPSHEGPYRIRVVGAQGTGHSFPFGIGPSWTTRVATARSLEFLAESMCYFGDFTLVGAGQLTSDVNGPGECIKGAAWRDAAHYGHELTTVADLLDSNPELVLQVPGDPDLFTNAPDDLADDAPLAAQLLYWGATVLLAEQVNEPQLKGQLASFLHVYPLVSAWLPQSLYEDVRDYTFASWDQTPRDRFVWQAYTPGYDGNLLGLYTAIGTGKGELGPGFSIIPNLHMHEVALREGRDDAGRYLDAAVAQAVWLAENLDPADPQNTKGQRQSEWLLVTSLVRLASSHPERTPESVRDFVGAWADVALERSDNLWDFRKYDDSGTSTDRWTIPSFLGGASGDPNETGNVAGFAAPALAAAHLLGAHDPRYLRLREIAAAHVDNIFGRNPTNRAAQYEVSDPLRAYEGLDRGWFSEHQGGYGILQGLPGVLDGSPKNAHYPYNPGLQNIGWTEGWVNFNTAFVASLAWLGFTERHIEIASLGSSDGSLTLRQQQAKGHDRPAVGDSLEVVVWGPYESARRSDLIQTVQVNIGKEHSSVVVQPVGDGSYRAVISTVGASNGDKVMVRAGSGTFQVTARVVLAGRSTKSKHGPWLTTAHPARG